MDELVYIGDKFGNPEDGMKIGKLYPNISYGWYGESISVTKNHLIMTIDRNNFMTIDEYREMIINDLIVGYS